MDVRFQPVDDVAALEARWRALEAAVDADFFSSWGWVGTWLDWLPSSARPMAFIAEADGAVVALALFCKARVSRRVGLVTGDALFARESGDPVLDQITPEGAPLLVRPGYEGAAAHALFQALNDEPGLCDEFVARNAPRAWAQRLQNAALNADFKLRAIRRDETYWVALADLEGPYVDRLSRNSRWRIRRARALFEQTDGPIRCQEARTVEDAFAIYEDLKRLHRAAWEWRGLKGAFDVPEFDDFHRRLIENRFEAGEIQLLQYTAGSTVFAALYNFVYRNRVYAYQSGFEFRADNRFKPGLIAHADAIERGREAKRLAYDFLGGRYQYKESLGTNRAPILSFRAQKRAIAFETEALLSGFKQRLFRDRKVGAPPKRPGAL